MEPPAQQARSKHGGAASRFLEPMILKPWHPYLDILWEESEQRVSPGRPALAAPSLWLYQACWHRPQRRLGTVVLEHFLQGQCRYQGMNNLIPSALAGSCDRLWVVGMPRALLPAHWTNT